MSGFLNDNFLLQNDTAIKLYHNYAKDMPIFDYHCHLSPSDIDEDRKYRNITELWLGGDHYKWRALRSNGVDERYITGEADDREKFIKWAETVPKCIGNPLYEWTHLELRRFFGINKLLSSDTAVEIWDECNDIINNGDFSVRRLIDRLNVKVLCTTDDPVDSLEHHIALAKDKSFNVKVLPAFRPDRSINIDKAGFIDWIRKLGDVSGVEIKSFEDLQDALTKRIKFFHEVGCRLSDHALDPVIFEEGSAKEASTILRKALAGKKLSDVEIRKYKTQVLLFLGRQYAQFGWVMQLHIGTIRNNNKKMQRLLGPDSGFDAIGDFVFAEALAKYLNQLNETDELPKTILYCLNPRDNEVLASLAGCFQGTGIPGKIQFGSGWWFNDQKDGMIKQMSALSNLGLLSNFVGMLTDSRSFMSYPRHEYFRRILCNLIGEWVKDGQAPDDIDLLGRMVQDVCFNNARDYFRIEIPC